MTPSRLTKGKQQLKILEATYGHGTDVIDVTERLQGLVKNGHLCLTVSNSLFTDPCPGKVKTLRFTYDFSGSTQCYSHEVKEYGLAIAPLVGGDRIGIFYTNNSGP